jgi:REP element-mobilizing transposase RayT
MTMPRRQIVDVAVTRYYHCISRCVRRAFLCGEGVTHRKTWIEARLELLARHFAVSVCGFAILDNHLHVLCRLDPGIADGWSDEEVVSRWIAVYRPSCLNIDNPATVQAWIDQQCQDTARVARYRERLQDLGWFMKALKEPLARLANKEDHCTGTFWEARYKSIAILDEQALLATCAYIDLNPFAAGIAKTPEDAPHTSIKQRVDHVRKNGYLDTLHAAAAAKSVVAAIIEADLEQSHWLCPLQDRKTAGEGSAGAAREGMLPGFSLSSYLELVDWTARLCRTGRARITREVAGIMTRLGTSPEYWQSQLRKLIGKDRWLGNYCATSAKFIKAMAAKHGVHHVDNALGCMATG